MDARSALGRRGRALRAALLRRLRRAALAGRRPRHLSPGNARDIEVTLGGAAAARLLPTGGVGGARWRLGAAPAGLGGRAAGRTLLTFLVLLYAVFLGSSPSPARCSRSGCGSGPWLLTAIPPRGGLGSRSRSGLRPAAAGQRGRRASRAPALLGAAVRDALGLVRSVDVRLLGAWPGGRSTRPCCGRCSTRFGARAVAGLGARLLRRAGRQHESRSPAPSAAASSACCWPSASTPTWRSSRCSATAPWRSGCPRRSASPRSPACAARSRAGQVQRTQSTSTRLSHEHRRSPRRVCVELRYHPDAPQRTPGEHLHPGEDARRTQEATLARLASPDTDHS